MDYEKLTELAMRLLSDERAETQTLTLARFATQKETMDEIAFDRAIESLDERVTDIVDTIRHAIRMTSYKSYLEARIRLLETVGKP